MRLLLLTLLASLPFVQAFALPSNELYHYFELDQSLADSSVSSIPLSSPGLAPVYDADGHLTNDSSDYAASFDGAERYLTIATTFSDLKNTHAYTVSAWFKSDVAPSGGQRFSVFETSPNYTASLGLREGADTSKTMVQFFTRTDQNNGLNISAEVPDSEITARWFHAALTFDGTTLTAYLDGKSVGSLNLSNEGEMMGINALRIGTYRDANGRFFDGLIDDVAVWTRALTPSEVKEISDETATTRYVNFLNGGLDAAPYDSWSNAATDLQDALAIARPGDEIWIAKGTYYPDQGGTQTLNDQNATFTLKDSVAIYGGFWGGETSKDEADPSANETILSGDIDQNNGAEEQRDFSKYEKNSYHVITAKNVDATASLTGLTIKHGFAAGDSIADQLGAGLHCENASPSLSNLIFEANVAVAGGAISCDNASPSIANCTFRNNTASDGAAFYNRTNASPSITNSVFHGNLALDNAGAVFNDGSAPTFTNCTFYDNKADKEAGVFFNYDSNPILTNCTLYGNVTDREGGALYNAETSFPKLNNCIIWNNKADGASNTADASIHDEDGDSATVASYSLVENISKATLDFNGTPTNFEPTNPLFLSATPTKIGDFQLRTSSPAIDAGSNELNSSLTDLAGNARIQNSTIDLGAIEGGQEILRLYVNASNAANAATPYDTWGTAAATLQDALASSQPGDEIWVAQGTYYPDEGGSQTDNDRAATFTLDNDIALYGGFTGNETERASADPRSNETILSGDIDQNDGNDFSNTANNAIHVVIASGNALLDGFTVTAGNADSGTNFDDRDSSGAGLYLGSNDTATVSNCSFHSNQASVYGGAIHNNGGTLALTNTAIQGNTSLLAGGGISNIGATTTLNNCLITGNLASSGGGCDNFISEVTLINCTLHGNKAESKGGALYNYSSSPVLKNSIIWKNQASGVTDASIFNTEGSSPVYQSNLDDFDDPLFFLEIDPATAPTTSGDLRLQVNSPAIDRAEADYNTVDTDVAGNERYQGKSMDMGAYETPFTEIQDWEIDTAADSVDPASLSASFTLDSGSLPANWQDTVTVTTTGTASYSSRNSTTIGGTIYTLYLEGLSGEGSYTLTFDQDVAGARGDILKGGASITFQRHTSTTPIHYVDARNDEDEKAPYNTWGKAATSLQDVLEIASPGDEIWVAAGTYYPDQGLEQTEDDRTAAFVLKNGVALYGGFSGNETDRAAADPQANETILSGDIDQNDGSDFSNTDNNSYHVVTARDTNHTAILQGFTIQDGYANNTGNEDGGGLLIDNAFPRIKSCVFQNNQATDNGGGIAIKGDAAYQAITDCVFIENTAFNGGAINISGKGLADFVGCVFKENSAHYGGAIYISGETSPHTWNCTFQGNHANNGGGAIASSTTSYYTVGNCLFQGNQTGDYGGAVIITDGSPRFVNSAFQGNQTANKGGAIAILTELDPTFENCIIWNNQANGATNTPNASIHVEANSTPTYSHCLVEHYAKDDLDSSGTSPDTNLIPADPRFVLEADPANAPTTIGDLRLRAGSPAIDRGLNSANITTTDLAGNDRIQNSTIDLGPYEFHSLAINSWTLDNPEAIDATSLSTTLTLSKALPTGWEATLSTSATGTAAASGLEVSGSGPVYTITLTGLSGEGHITIQLDTSSQVFQGNTITGTSARVVTRYSSASPTHFVNANSASPAAPYDSWATAASDLQDALEFAQSGDEIWVAQGTYYPDEGQNQTDNDRHATFTLKNGVALYGGFTGGETDRASANAGANETILSGDIDQDDAPDANTYNVLTAKGLNDSAKLQGFTIQGGNADHPDQELQTAGAGLLCDTSDPTFTNCTFRNNQAVFGGVAVFISNSTPVFTNCAFYGNSSEREGGALYNDDSSPVLINCTLFGNIADREGGAIYNDNGSHPELTNTIVWNNQADDGTNTANASVFEQGGSSTIYSNSLVGGYLKAELDASGSSPDTNIATSDPLFQSAATGDLSLTPASPAIDTGDNSANTAPIDLAGNARIQNSTIDLGAYEFTPYTQRPVIVLNGDANIAIAPDEQWIDPGATATDQAGDPVTVTSNETFPAGKIVITYDATDSFGNEAIQVIRTVTLADLSTPPVITLNGAALATVPFGSTWADPGATATDVLGADVAVTTGGDTVKTDQAYGVFTITYNATDSFDNVAQQVTRAVHVVGVIDFDPDSNHTLDTLSWTDGWILQTSTDLKVWTDVPDAQSPFTIPSITEDKQFWRLRKAD